MTTPALGDSVGENAYRAVRNDIIFGRLRPSERLRLEILRKRYNVSVTTLREILNRLTSDGFVVAEGQKGFEVAPVSEKDLREVADLRILLESHALEQSFANGDLNWEAGVVAAYHKLNVMEKRMMSGDEAAREGWKIADWGFHRALIAGCGSSLLIDIHGEVFDKYLRYQMLTLTYRGEVAIGEHKQLLDAALAHDSKTAIAVLRRHLEGGIEHSLKHGNSRSKDRKIKT